MALYQVYVNVRAMYTVEADGDKAAREEALKAASDRELPEGIEYVGDGVEYSLLVSE